MGISMRYTESDTLEVALKGIEQASEEVSLEVQKKAGKIIKARVIGELNRIKRSGEKVASHMVDDVQVITKRDRFGNPLVRIQGGRKTGTLWHIVNDGTYRTRAHHFMDRAVSESEQEIETLIDEEMRKAGF